jgi:hypothetical protein
MKCERCGKPTVGMEIHDYCADCGKNLCDDCMKAGCCGNVPAKSGQAEDFGDDDDDDERDQAKVK